MGNLSSETSILQFQQVIDRKPGERHNQSVEFEDDINALFETYQTLLPMAEEDEARLWTKFRLDWNYNSNRIEGNTLTRGETKALLEEGIKPIRMRKDILQMQSHDKAIDFLKELVESDAPLTEVDIRNLHETALGENYWTEAITAENVITKREIEIGVYKKVPNVVLKSDGTTHEYAAPNEVPIRMAATLKSIRQYLKNPDLQLYDFMAELHQDFIQTHPFDDGNGRMVRLLINYVCLKLGWPPVIIKSEKRADYIAALENWNDGNEAPFRKLMKEELTWSLKKSIQAARGENIDDPEDLDKEIDLFVREKGVQFGELDRERNIKKRKLREEFYFLNSEIEKNFVKFSTLFEQRKQISNYDYNHESSDIIKRPASDNNIVHRHSLIKWKGYTENIDIILEVILHDESDTLLIHGDLKIWKNHSMDKERLVHPKNKKYADGQFFYRPYQNKSIEIFTKAIIHSIFKEIELFP